MVCPKFSRRDVDLSRGGVFLGHVFPCVERRRPAQAGQGAGCGPGRSAPDSFPVSMKRCTNPHFSQPASPWTVFMFMAIRAACASVHGWIRTHAMSSWPSSRQAITRWLPLRISAPGRGPLRHFLDGASGRHTHPNGTHSAIFSLQYDALGFDWNSAAIQEIGGVVVAVAQPDRGGAICERGD